LLSDPVERSRVLGNINQELPSDMKNGLAIGMGRHQGGSTGLERILKVGVGIVLVGV
jgi:hypothetical protein